MFREDFFNLIHNIICREYISASRLLNCSDNFKYIRLFYKVLFFFFSLNAQEFSCPVELNDIPLNISRLAVQAHERHVYLKFQGHHTVWIQYFACITYSPYICMVI